MVATICQSGAVILKAGSNVSSVLVDDDYVQLINQAEALVSCTSRKDWVTLYSGMDANLKLILEMVVSDIAAIYAIEYDMGGYNTRAEAESMVTILRDNKLLALGLLRNQQVATEFL